MKTKEKKQQNDWSRFYLNKDWQQMISADRRKMTWRVFWQFVFAITTYTIVMASVCVAAYLIIRAVCVQYVWYPFEWLYVFLKIMQFAGPALAVLLYFVVAGVITFHFLSKPLGYLSEVVQAAEQLSHLSDEPIVLSRECKNVQDQMNFVREQAILNAQMAKQAEQRKNDLIVYLAHDLKTPLTSVIGYLTLLRDEPQISPELREKYTLIAYEKSERLEELINDFFDITRFNLTQLSIEFERVNLTRMLDQIAYEFRPAMIEKNMTISINYENQVEMICDPRKLERVFDNLYRNAINYGYPQTEITTYVRSDDESVVVTVSNCGKTIPPEKLERVFEQFFRMDSSRGTSTGGAGLGLAIAKEIVELHNGSITAQSENETILFTVELPLDCQKNV